MDIKIKTLAIDDEPLALQQLASYIKNIDLPIYIDGDNNESDLFVMEFIFNYIGHRLNMMILDKPDSINL